MSKKRIITSIKKLSPEILELFNEKYPDGYAAYATKIDKGNGDYFYTVPLDTDDTSYLVKVDVKIDTKPDENDDKFMDENDDGSSESNMIQFDESEHDVADE